MLLGRMHKRTSVAAPREDFIGKDTDSGVSEDRNRKRRVTRPTNSFSPKRCTFLIATIISSFFFVIRRLTIGTGSRIRGRNFERHEKLRTDVQVGATSVKVTLRTLREADYDAYTVRINTWKRPDQLKFSLNYHSTCEHIAQIQVVWCDAQGEPPTWLYSIPKVVVERHTLNSLNERFRILIEPLTYGILSIDDDVLRPCTALDATFVKWTRQPDRLVGFDARSHQVDPDTGQWSYGYLSTTERTNRYSMTLPRFSFLHVDYLHAYFHSVPAPILQFVDKNFNCEDIALSFWISSLTDSLPPLLADDWAEKTVVKLASAEAISDTSNHKALRDECTNKFSLLLNIKSGERELRARPLYHGGGGFRRGVEVHQRILELPESRLGATVDEMLERWNEDNNPKSVLAKGMAMKCKVWAKAYHMGLAANKNDRCRGALSHLSHQ